jgi:hypothetical protein
MTDRVVAIVEPATEMLVPRQFANGQQTPADAQQELPFISVANLSDTQGVGFGPYLAAWKKATVATWQKLFTPEAIGPDMRRGVATIRLKILRNGQIVNGSLILEGRSGSTALDRAVWVTLVNSRYPSLPSEFHSPFIELRTAFSFDQHPPL